MLSKTMKFYEVTTQFVLTGHVIGYDLCAFSPRPGTRCSPSSGRSFAGAAETASTKAPPSTMPSEKETADFFKGRAEVYAPTSRPSAPRRRSTTSPLTLAKAWPKGMLERINAIK